MTPARAAAIAAAALVGEYVVVTVLFDAVPGSPGLSWLRGGLGLVVPCVVAIGSAAYVLARPALQGDGQLVAPIASRSPAAAAGIHLGLFACFLWATNRLFASGGAAGSADFALLAVWALLGAGTVVSLAAAAFDPSWLLGLVWRKRALLLAAIVTGIAAFAAGRAAERLWAPLGAATLSCVAFLLRPILPGLIVRPEDLAVGTDRFLVFIAPECSGLEGIGLVSAFVAVYLATARERIALPAGLMLFPVGIAAAWSANVLRIAGLVWVGSEWSAPLAAGGLHSKIGWLLFCAIAVGLVLFANRTTLLSRTGVEEPGANPEAGHLLPFAAFAAATFVAGIPSDGWNALRPLRLIAVILALWLTRANRPPLRLRRSWEAPVFGAAAFLLTVGLERLTATPSITSLDAFPAQAGAVAIWIVELVTVVVAIPIACELAFRGYLLRRLAGKPFTGVDPRQAGWIPLLLSACAYAAVAGSFWTLWPAGLLYGLAYRRRGQLSDAILAHAVASLLGVLASLGMSAAR